MKKTLALIFGGEGAERHISESGAVALISKLTKSTELLKIGISPDGDWFIYRGANEKIENGEWLLSDALTPTYPVRLSGVSGFYTEDGIVRADAAFPLLHGDFGEDGIIQSALKSAHIPYIGSPTAPSAISADKAYTKIVAEHLGIPTVPWMIPEGKSTLSARLEAEKRLGYPMFIKPRALGSSIGAHPVHNSGEFAAAYKDAAGAHGGAIIEQLIDIAAELEFALYDGEKRFISRAGVILSQGRFYDYAAKYEGDGTPEIQANADYDRKITRHARRYARRLADFLGLGNISRIDFFVTPQGKLYFNEINSIPGMTESSLYPRLAEEAGKLKLSAPEALLMSGKYQ